MNLHSARFHFNINLWVYMVTCALVWASCLYSVGVYHRHAMGDGRQLNVLLFKKRVFDIVVSLVALVGTAIITIPVAIAIKMADGGPIFYTQTRVDRRGKTFKMIKFRSMVVNADKMKAELAEKTGQQGRFVFKKKDDPRVTTVGKFIRKYSIDEFTQFFECAQGRHERGGTVPAAASGSGGHNRRMPPACWSSPASPAHGRCLWQIQPERGGIRGSGRPLRAELVHVGGCRIAVPHGWC